MIYSIFLTSALVLIFGAIAWITLFLWNFFTGRTQIEWETFDCMNFIMDLMSY